MTRKSTRGRFAQRTMPIACPRCRDTIAYGDVDGFPEPRHWADAQFYEVGPDDNSASMPVMVITCRTCGTESYTASDVDASISATNPKHGYYIGRGRWMKVPD